MSWGDMSRPPENSQESTSTVTPVRPVVFQYESEADSSSLYNIDSDALSDKTAVTADNTIIHNLFMILTATPQAR